MSAYGDDQLQQLIGRLTSQARVGGLQPDGEDGLPQQLTDRPPELVRGELTDC